MYTWYSTSHVPFYTNECETNWLEQHGYEK